MAEIKRQVLDQIIGYLGVSGKFGNPEVLPLTNETYIEARSEWITNGIAELDFDGKIYFNQPYLRLFYNMFKARAGLTYHNDNCETRCIRGPVDLLWIENDMDKETCHLYRTGNHIFNDDVLKEWSDSGAGRISVYRELDGERVILEFTAAEMESPQIRRRILQFFFVEA